MKLICSSYEVPVEATRPGIWKMQENTFAGDPARSLQRC